MIKKLSVAIALLLPIAVFAQSSYQCQSLQFKTIDPSRMSSAEMGAAKYFNSLLAEYKATCDCDPSVNLKEVNPSYMSLAEISAAKSHNQNALRTCQLKGK